MTINIMLNQSVIYPAFNSKSKYISAHPDIFRTSRTKAAFSFFFIIILWANPNCFSQTKFQLSVGGNGNSFANSIIQNSNGDYVTAGYTNSYGAGSNDVYVVCFGQNGLMKWNRTIGGPGDDVALTIIQTGTGSYAVSSETSSYGVGGFDEFLIMLDSSGNLLWSRTYGGGGEEYGECTVNTFDGGFAMGGYTNSFGAGSNDSYIMKLDAAGSVQWMKTFGFTSYDYALCVIQTADSGYALLGSSDHSGTSFLDYFVIKLSSSGTLQWSKTIGGPEGDYGFSIIQTTDGGYALSGTTLSYGAGNYDLYIVKLDQSGNTQWTRSLGGSDFDYGYSIIQTHDGGFAVSGSTASFGAGSDDAFIVKIDNNGSQQWCKTFGAAYHDSFLSIRQVLDGGYISAGSMQPGNSEMFIVKFDSNWNTCGNTGSVASASGSGGNSVSVTPIESNYSPAITDPIPSVSSGAVINMHCNTIGLILETSEVPQQFTLYQNYPNPFNPSTKIKYQIAKNNPDVKLMIFDINGKEITTIVNQKQTTGTYETEWDAANYPSGTYFYQLIIEGKILASKRMVLLK